MDQPHLHPQPDVSLNLPILGEISARGTLGLFLLLAIFITIGIGFLVAETFMAREDLTAIQAHLAQYNVLPAMQKDLDDLTLGLKAAMDRQEEILRLLIEWRRPADQHYLRAERNQKTTLTKLDSIERLTLQLLTGRQRYEPVGRPKHHSE